MKSIYKIVRNIMCIFIIIICFDGIHAIYKDYEFVETEQISIISNKPVFSTGNLIKSKPIKTNKNHLIELKEDKINNGVLSNSNLSVDELQKGLLKELRQYAHLFINAEKETGINAIFLSSVAALESGWGTSDVSINKNNLFGWTMECGSYREFDSVSSCIEFVSLSIKENYLSTNGVYFSGYEVEDINKHYNGREEWAISINQIMEQVNNRIKGGVKK